MEKTRSDSAFLAGTVSQRQLWEYFFLTTPTLQQRAIWQILSKPMATYPTVCFCIVMLMRRSTKMSTTCSWRRRHGSTRY